MKKNKTYTKLHASRKAAASHASKIKRRKGTIKKEMIKGKTKLTYWF